MLFQEFCASYESFMKRDHWKRIRSVSYSSLKLLKLKKNSITALQLLQFLILKKGLRHFLATLKVFTIEKGLHHFLETLKGFNFEKRLHLILMTLKVFQNSYSLECWWAVASEGRLSYHLRLTNFTCSECPIW